MLTDGCGTRLNERQSDRLAKPGGDDKKVGKMSRKEKDTVK